MRRKKGSQIRNHREVTILTIYSLPRLSCSPYPPISSEHSLLLCVNDEVFASSHESGNPESVPHVVYLHTGSIRLQDLQGIEPFGIIPGSLGSRQVWIAHALVVIFTAVPKVVCHGLLDSSLGKLACTSCSAVSLYTIYT